MSPNLMAIDIFKYIAAVCVIAVHTFTTSSIENIGALLFINGIARVAVPFFFCCTGYFLAQKGIENRNAIFTYLKKIFKVYIFWSAVYIPVEIIKMVGTDTLDSEHLTSYLHSILVQGSFLHLWYFPSLIFSVALLYFCYKNFPLSLLCFFSIILYILGLIGDGYFGILQHLPSWINVVVNAYLDLFLSTRNGLFFGFPFVLMGVIIFRYKNILNKINFKPLLIVSLIFVCLETYGLNKLHWAMDFNLTLFIVPATAFLLCTLLNCSLSFSIDSKLFRDHSTLLYKCHLLFYGAILAFVTFFELTFFDLAVVRFFAVFIASQAFVYLIIQTRKFKAINRKTL